ncbi:MAG: hypothetical protein P8Y42_16780 [Exilibacterium sp.]
MKALSFFVNRRSGHDRRHNFDPCKDMPVDMFHRKRRKSSDRRKKLRTLKEDYYAFIQAPEPTAPECDSING